MNSRFLTLAETEVDNAVSWYQISIRYLLEWMLET